MSCCALWFGWARHRCTQLLPVLLLLVLVLVLIVRLQRLLALLLRGPALLLQLLLRKRRRWQQQLLQMTLTAWWLRLAEAKAIFPFIECRVIRPEVLSVKMYLLEVADKGGM